MLVKKRPTRTGNQKKLGIIVAIFFGFILLSSTIFFGIAPPEPQRPAMPEPGQVTITGTPQDNYPDDQRAMFCGQSEPTANAYITEYGVPTICTQPLAITTTPDGGVWFAQSNTGNLARFDRDTQTITEFENPFWDDAQRSMIWGMDHDNGFLWYTDEANDSVWRFDISQGTYRQFLLPVSEDSFPQQLLVHGTDIILNDLQGNALVVLDASDPDGGLVYNSLPSNTTGAVTAGFALDRAGVIWYTTWIDGRGGLLVGVDPNLVRGQNASDIIIETLPSGLRTPNGAAADHRGNIWLADTSSSYFFMYDPASESFSHYVTSRPDPLSYGNLTGVIQTPISRPYWMMVNDRGDIVFNEQTANRIAVMDPRTEKLVEYSIPSRNPFWADCRGDPACGIAQVLSITVDGSEVWFTEWAENSIGMLDTAKPLPFDISIQTPRLTLAPGESASIAYAIESTTERPIAVEPVSANTHTYLHVVPHRPPQLILLENSEIVTLDIVSTPDALPGEYKILLGAESGSVSVSRYVTVEILPVPQPGP